MTNERKYRVGLIGTGRKGNGHARGYEANPRTDLVAAADPDPSNLAIFLERFTVKPYDDYHEMLRMENIDIAAPILPVKPNPGSRHRLREGRRQRDLLREADGSESR